MTRPLTREDVRQVARCLLLTEAQRRELWRAVKTQNEEPS